MNIFYFSGTRLPSQDAQSVHVMKMAQAFGKAGYNLTLFAQNMSNAASEELFEIYDTDPCFSIYTSAYWGIPLLSHATQYLELKSKIAKLDAPQLIYGHDVISLALFARPGVPIIYEANNISQNPSENMAIQRLLKNRDLIGIVTVSDVLKQELLDRYTALRPEDIFVAHDGADLIDNITAMKRDDIVLMGRKEALNVGYAGSLSPGKGLALIARIAKQRPQYDFHILGGTSKQVQKLQTENHLKNLYFYGHRDHAEVQCYLKKFDVCIAPYQHRALIKTGRNTSRWISPMKIFEYMAAEKPIICSNLPVIHEVLEHGKNALLLPASDEIKWAMALDDIRKNPEGWKKMAHNAVTSLTEKYTWDKRVQAIMSFCMDDQSQIRFESA